jgi:uncharacterized membrane protein YeaQ/YmgE (transglycosylase-associated protein family)
VTSIIESAGAMGFAGWVVLGVVAGWIACSIPPDCEPTQAGRLLVGVLGAVLGGVVASPLGLGSAATFFSLGPWVVACAGSTASLAIHSIHVDRSRPPHSPPAASPDESRGSTSGCRTSARADRRGEGETSARWGPPPSLWPPAGRWARERPDNAHLTPYANASSSPTMGP